MRYLQRCHGLGQSTESCYLAGNVVFYGNIIIVLGGENDRITSWTFWQDK